MSREIELYIKNSSGWTIDSFKIGHEWDNHLDAYPGTNLALKDRIVLGKITTGYNEHDNYEVNVTANGKTHRTTFYCDSSHSHQGVTINVNLNPDGICDCQYWDSNPDTVDTSCNNKGDGTPSS